MVSECIEVAGINRATMGREGSVVLPRKPPPTVARLPAAGSWRSAGAGGAILKEVVVAVGGDELRPWRVKGEDDE